ncbi:MAG: tRNA adenosine(34) deaminase TadA [Propionibacteriaceae bacterium]|nr:tRNA adenosine(34) deaminase TadA [Propionibacteriaceae bacterium]
MGVRWHAAMRLALDEARAAQHHGDVPIGAVILAPDGQVLAAAGNERELHQDPTAHAELVAIRRAADVLGEWRLEGCTIVVTLEPCTMCAGAIVSSRLARLVFGAFDEKAGAVASLFDVVRDRRLNHAVEVSGGVLADECAAQLRAFFDRKRAESSPVGVEGAQTAPSAPTGDDSARNC